MMISEIRGDFAVRQGVHEEHVHRLARSDQPLPPILVHHPTRRVIDGVHRLRAAALDGREKIEVEFFHGTEAEAFIRAVTENARHGLPLPLADRKAAALHIVTMRPEWSDRAIGRRTGLAAKTVAKLRRRSTEDSPGSNTRTGVDGRPRPLNGADGRRRAATVITRMPGASLREIARIAGVSLGTAHDVRHRLRQGRDPVPDGLRRPGESEKREEPQRPSRPEPAVAEGDARQPERSADPALQPPAPPARLPALLQALTQDPSLRQSALGRRLLQLLHTQSMTADDWITLVDVVPPHRLTTVTAAARQCAESWDRFAGALQERMAGEDDGQHG